MYLQQGHYLHNDKYQLLNVLGDGGFSLTYRGLWKTEVQGELGKLPTYLPVCIKEYFFKDYCLRNSHTYFVETNNNTGKEIFDKNKEKVIREARILSEIHHPNVVNVLEVFKQNNTVYIVMEFIDGHSLKQEVEQNGVLNEERLKKIIYKIGQSLDYIHEKNILHLDIKPNNILMDKFDNPKLIDFGISKRYDFSGDQETSTTLLAASKGYASVEQYDSEAMQVFSPRPDIYSLGATMYYLLTGQVPTESILRSTKGLQAPGELNSAISESIEKVILKAMELNASNRYETVMDMLVDLGFDPETDKIDLSVVAASEEEKYKLIQMMGEEIYDADAGDETIINPIEKKKSNKRKDRLAISLIISLIIGVSLFILFRNEQPTKPIAEFEIPKTPVSILTPADSLNSPQEKSDSGKTLNNNAVNNNSKPLETEEKTEEEIDQENYNKAFNDALQAYSAQNFSKALNLFKKSETYRETVDAKKYISLCNSELEKIEIQKKKILYDVMMNFGNFAVVKKKLNGLYGAIDDKGNEIIQCIYISTEPSGEDRLFQRDDNLYDKYDFSGKKVASGISGFE